LHAARHPPRGGRPIDVELAGQLREDGILVPDGRRQV
jgi:hypothetical protein